MSKKLIFDKMNYVIMLAGMFVITLGFVLMGMESAEYGFGSLGLTVGPIVVLIGFGVEFFAIFHKKKESTTSED